jgi:glutamine---fructose-6-phosphate transaminase (isomerizing)
MCGIFGIIGSNVSTKEIAKLALSSERRGRDSSGLTLVADSEIQIFKTDDKIHSLLPNIDKSQSYNIIFGHTRLITTGVSDNQPVVDDDDDVIVVHNGIIINTDEMISNSGLSSKLQIDTESILLHFKSNITNLDLEEVCSNLLALAVGTMSICVFLPKLNKLVLLSNNGSLHFGLKAGQFYFASEKHSLNLLGIEDPTQILNEYKILDLNEPFKDYNIVVNEINHDRINLIPEVNYNQLEDKLLRAAPQINQRCSKCILPTTMPFIKFDENGVCNYCNNYSTVMETKDKSDFISMLEPFRKGGKRDVIIPFSGGRDSCYGLHLAVEEFGLKPITYTYDWGMVTDLARRNISRMCSKLGVENIIIAADIQKKRANIRMNLQAWLKSPHLGMISMLTAGDKHFFRYVKDIQQETGISLNLWGVNPLEVTHFKAGFLGIPPSFEDSTVYNNGLKKQLRYQKKRFGAMIKSPTYFNSSIFDTLSGEYYRSIASKKDYHHIFDYWKWDEELIDQTLINTYDWETAADTPSTWRIGDGTAGFYNYIYTTVAGFSEHDTFRSNQVREGIITREQALALVMKENQPRFPNIKWYLDTLGLDYEEVIKKVNMIPKLYDL